MITAEQARANTQNANDNKIPTEILQIERGIGNNSIAGYNYYLKESKLLPETITQLERLGYKVKYELFNGSLPLTTISW